MSVSLQELAELVGGTLQGDGTTRIERAAPLNEARPGDITFVADKKYEALVPTTQASAVIVYRGFADSTKPLIRVDDPLESFLLVCGRLHKPQPRGRVGVHPQSLVDPTARLGQDVNIYPFAVVGPESVIGHRVDIRQGAFIGARCRLGDDVVIYPNVTIYDETVIGHRVIIHSGAVIGSDGFGYRLRNGRHEKIPQMGHVEIGDDVEIGACTTIDRATFGVTRVGRGTKIDNLVMIGHNCQIGEDCLLISQVGVAGSCTIGNRVVMAGQVGVADHIRIGDDAVIGAQAGVTKDVRAGDVVLGSPAAPAVEMKRMLMSLTRLPEFKDRLRKVEARLEELSTRQEAAGP